jgi:hypothetical protein
VPSSFGNLTSLTELLLDGGNSLTGTLPIELAQLEGSLVVLEVDRTLDAFNCSSYSLAGSLNATAAYRSCTVMICAGAANSSLSGCPSDGGQCGGDQFLRVHYSNGSYYRSNDDYCGQCSRFDWPSAPPRCVVYDVRQGCKGTGQCSGRLHMSGWNAYVIGQVAQPTSQPSPQTLALRDFFNATGGANWINSGNWSSTSEVCSSSHWYGVTCDGGNVTGLFLGFNNLVGYLPPSIGSLPALVSLDLSGNYLRGPIPSTLGLVSGLQNVSLAFNELTGSIPSTFGDVQQASLRYLDARYNHLNGTLPPALGNVSTLEVVLLGNNSLTGRVGASPLRSLACRSRVSSL